jgi:hypothetical protein
MKLRPGDDDSQLLSTDKLAIETELLVYAARVAPTPSAAFIDRVMAAVEQSPLPIAGWSRRVRASELVQAAGRRLGVAVAQVTGGPSIPLRVRLQAGAMLVVVVLLITAGAALAAAGASSVVTWVAAPQASAADSRPSASPTLSPNQPSDTSPTSDHPNGSSNPGNHGQPSQNPGNHGQPSQNPGNHGQPSQNPGNRPSDHPDASHNPGNGGGTKPDPHADESGSP